MTENTNSFDKWLHGVWEVGSKVEVYLPSSNQWAIGDIIRINNDSSLDVEYTYNNETKTKHINNNDTSIIRPWSKSLTVYKYVFNNAILPDQKEQTPPNNNTTAFIPSAASVRESAIINANINDVWNTIKSATFDFLSAVKSANKNANDNVGDVITINYNDGTLQTIQVTEISFLSHTIRYSLISSEPAVSYSSAYNQIKLIEVTTNNQTYIEWRTDFSNDASLSVIRDSRFKKKEAFQDLRDYLSTKISNDSDGKKEEIGSSDADEKNEEIPAAYVDTTKPIDRANITTEQYYNMEAKRYASDKWVRVVAEAFVKKIGAIRPFQKTDVLLDVGCGPGITTVSVMNSDEKEPNSIGSTAFMVDMTAEFIKIAKKNVADIPNKKIFIEKMNVFSKDAVKGDLSMRFKELLSNKIEYIDCGYMTLVSEYLSKAQLITMASEVCKKLSVGGIFACMDWGEHLHYPPIYGNGLFWNRGITKKDWLEIAAEVVENIENGSRVVKDEEENKKKASRSEYTITVWNSTFEIQLDVKDSNSYLHYVVFRKDKVNEKVN